MEKLINSVGKTGYKKLPGWLHYGAIPSKCFRHAALPTRGWFAQVTVDIACVPQQQACHLYKVMLFALKAAFNKKPL